MKPKNFGNLEQHKINILLEQLMEIKFSLQVQIIKFAIRCLAALF